MRAIKIMFIIIPVLLFGLMSSASSQDFELVMSDVDGHFQVADDYLFFPDAISDFYGFSSDCTAYCSDATPKTVFNWGDCLYFNAFWQDQGEADGINSYDITFAYKHPATGKLGILWQGIWDAGPVAPGKTYTFCFASRSDLPSAAGRVNVDWGARVIKLENGQKVQGELGTISIH